MPASILIAEDEPIVAVDLAQQLTKAGYQIVGPAKTAARALDLAQRTRCDAAILDYELCTADGETIVLYLSDKRIPFVFISGHPPAAMLRKYPGTPVITKPAAPDLIITIIRRLLP
ncbi:MAG: response regulator [Hyphomicrobium sp.]